MLKDDNADGFRFVETREGRPLPYGGEAMQIVGGGVPAPLCGVLPMVALTPKGVRYPGRPAGFDRKTAGGGTPPLQTMERADMDNF